MVSRFRSRDFRRLTNLSATRSAPTVQNDTLTYDSFGSVMSSLSNLSDVAVREKQCLAYTRRR